MAARGASIALYSLCLCSLFFVRTWAQSDAELTIYRADRIITLQTPTVRVVWNLKIEYSGSSPKSDFIFALPKSEAENLAFIQAAVLDGKQINTPNLEVTPLDSQVKFSHSHNVTLFSIKLSKPLKKGSKTTIEIYAAFTHLLTPFPAEILQTDWQLVLFHGSHFILSPYFVKLQSTVVKLPSNRVESFTPLDPARHSGKEIKFGTYENKQPFSFSPLRVHFEHNNPFPVVLSLVREIEISHWGNIYVTENYNLVHAGAKLKGPFSRLDYQIKQFPTMSSALKGLVARLPPRAHSLYYRDEIGNISTSHVRSEPSKTEMEFEPRYPIFGGWSATFTIGYSLPLEDFLFKTKEGSRILNMTFGCPLGELSVENLVIKVALPEGSKQISAFTPFPVNKYMEVKYSYLDTVGRPVIVLEKKNIVNEYSNIYFQVFYHFDNGFLLVEPVLLISAFMTFFLAFMAYVRFDFPISKNTPSYIAKLQKEEARDSIQLILGTINKRNQILEKLDLSLRTLGRSGDATATKATRSTVESSLKSTSADLQSAVTSLEKLAYSPSVLSKISTLLSKDKERVDKMLQKHNTVIQSIESKVPPKEIDSKILPLQSKIAGLNSEIKDLLAAIED